MTLTALRQLYEVELLAFLRPRYMRRQEWVHERFEVRPPPLGQRIANAPFIIDAFARELCADRCQTLVETVFEAFNLVVFRLQVVARSALTR